MLRARIKVNESEGVWDAESESESSSGEENDEDEDTDDLDPVFWCEEDSLINMRSSSCDEGGHPSKQEINGCCRFNWKRSYLREH
jgi:hypothetical protein